MKSKNLWICFGHFKSTQAYSDLSNSMEAIELQAAARLMDTKFATEIGINENQLINKYAN